MSELQADSGRTDHEIHEIQVGPPHCLSRVWNAFRLMPEGRQTACISGYQVAQLDQNPINRLSNKVLLTVREENRTHEVGVASLAKRHPTTTPPLCGLSCYFRASSKHLDDPASLLEKIVAYEARVTSFYYINL